MPMSSTMELYEGTPKPTASDRSRLLAAWTRQWEGQGDSTSP
ncbi:MAG TPA: hypothetical protein VL966_17505 [Alphaproteobacteria bacterium]|jgi:hypothetical protein|nr:hypothetical protein [Alphaproteobacteria bacterium]